MKLIIYAGRTFKADFTIVSDDGTTPQELEAGDSGLFSVQTAGDNPVSVVKDVPMVLLDMANGLFEVTLTAEQTNEFNQHVGFQEDRYSPLGNYEGHLEFTLVSGDRQAMVNIAVKEVA